MGKISVSILRIRRLKMTMLMNFLKTDVNLYVRNLILETISKGKARKKEIDELIFNRYSVKIFYEKDEVLLCDDIFLEEGTLIISLVDFETTLLSNIG
jgi:hypothetical protein